MKNKILFTIILIIFTISFATAASANVKIDYYGSGKAPEKHWVPLEAIQEEMKHINNSPYIDISKDDITAYIVSDYNSYQGTAGYDSFSLYASELYDPSNTKKVKLPGCAEEFVRLCSAQYVFEHELGHVLAKRITEKETKIYLEAINRTEYDEMGVKYEMMAHNFGEVFGSLDARYSTTYNGSTLLCDYKSLEIPFKTYYVYYSILAKDVKSMDLNSIPKMVKYDVNNDGRQDVDDLNIAKEMVNVKHVNENNIGSYWSSDVDYSNVVDEKDIKLIKEKINYVEPVEPPVTIDPIPVKPEEPKEPTIDPKYDLTKDGKINCEDMIWLASRFGSAYTGEKKKADFNNDRRLNIKDLKILAEQCECK
jgi:hypothetical protein